jgi:phosphoribosyl-ATP pyrophosphohydrolase
MSSISVLEDVYDVIEDRKENAVEGSYVCSLLKHNKGMDKILEKIGEESTEVILAAKNGQKERIIEESCDLFFHMLVMLSANNISLDEISAEMKGRRH